MWGSMPLNVAGVRADHVCAYARRHRDQTVIVVAPRFFARLPETAGTDGDIWQDTCIEPESSYGEKWYNMLSGERLAITSGKGAPHLRLNRLLSHFPLALLANAPE